MEGTFRPFPIRPFYFFVLKDSERVSEKRHSSFFFPLPRLSSFPDTVDKGLPSFFFGRGPRPVLSSPEFCCLFLFPRSCSESRARIRLLSSDGLTTRDRQSYRDPFPDYFLSFYRDPRKTSLQKKMIVLAFFLPKLTPFLPRMRSPSITRSEAGWSMKASFFPPS